MVSIISDLATMTNVGEGHLNLDSELFENAICSTEVAKKSMQKHNF
jgi:hypothetical protein